MSNGRICHRQLVFLLFVASIQTVQAQEERVEIFHLEREIVVKRRSHYTKG